MLNIETEKKVDKYYIFIKPVNIIILFTIDVINVITIIYSSYLNCRVSHLKLLLINYESILISL